MSFLKNPRFNEGRDKTHFLVFIHSTGCPIPSIFIRFGLKGV